MKIKQQQGISLIELMIAMALGAFMSVALVQTYLANSRVYNENEEMTRMQENARYALRYVSRELTMSGFLSGIEASSVGANAIAIAGDCSADWATDPTIAVEVVDNLDASSTTSSAGTALACIDGNVEGSDILTVKRLADTPSVDDGVNNLDVNASATYLNVDNGTGTYTFVSGDFGAVTTDTDVWRYFARAVFVREFSETAGDGITALCAVSLSTTMSTDCLAEGVERMQIEFGIDDNGDTNVNRFVTSPSTAESQSIVAARIYLLMRSIGEVAGYDNDVIYQLGSTPVNGGAAFNDGFYRRVFSTTVKLRNPLRI
jgi:type IV pilus assembly protein PilW